MHYNTYYRNNHFVTVLGFDENLGLDTFPYPINKYQTATEHHNATSQGFINDKAMEAMQANQHYTPEPRRKVGDMVLLSA